jgi:predicted transcriptional regulator
LSYLSDHPDAEDTVEGIVEWWLLEEEIKQRKSEVEGALAELVANDLVRVRKGADKRVRYLFNSTRQNEVRELLKQRREQK